MLWSFFYNTLDNRPKLVSSTWEEFCQSASNIVPANRELSADEAKKMLTGWSPAVWAEGYTRGIEGITGMEMVACDFDNSKKVVTGYRPNGSQIIEQSLVDNPATILGVAQHLQMLGINSLLYTSFSNKADYPKFRVAIPTNRFIKPEEFEGAVEYTLDVLGLNQWRESLDIKVMRDAARLYYVSCPWYTDAQRYVTQGKNLEIPNNLTSQITSLPEIPQTEEAKNQLAKINKDLNRVDDAYWWIPLGIDMATLNLPGMLRGMGYWVDEPKPYKGGLRYQCECPFSDEHGESGHNTGTCIIEGGDITAWPVFDCKHSHSLDLRKLLTQPERWNAPRRIKRNS